MSDTPIAIANPVDGSDIESVFDAVRNRVATPATPARDDLFALAESAPTEPRPVRKVGGVESQASQCVQMARERLTLHRTPEGEAFGLPRTGPRLPVMLRGGALRDWLSFAYLERYGKTVGSQAVSDALNALAGQAAVDGSVEQLHMRAVTHDGAVFYDMGDDTGAALRIRPGVDWAKVLEPPVCFRRTALTAPLPEPVAGHPVDEVFRFVNVVEADRPLVLAWLVAVFVAEVPHTVLFLNAEHGSGKSTATRLLGTMLDPSTAPLRRPPTTVDAWFTAATGSWIVTLDNLSTIPAPLSDALCRAVTGDGDVSRALYTNGDLFVRSMRRVLILNGIEPSGIRDDLADRALPVTLQPLSGNYRDERDILADFADAHPRILGGLLDLAVRVLGRLDRVHLEQPPRMVDFARILAAVDAELSTDGLTRYLEQSANFAADAVTEDPVLAAIVQQIRAPFEGTALELLDLISRDFTVYGDRLPKEWPANARAMTQVLKRRAPSLRKLGWQVDDLGRGGRQKVVRWRVAPPADDTSLPRAS